MLGFPSKPKIIVPKYLGENSHQEQFKHFCYTLALAVTALFSLEASEWQESGYKKEEIVRNCTIQADCNNVKYHFKAPKLL